MQNKLRIAFLALLVFSILLAGCTGAPEASQEEEEGPVCGDGVCEEEESPSTCSKDCGIESESEGPPVPTAS